MMIFQYFIDVFGKEFTFTVEHYDQIKESTIDFEDLMTQIYEEVSYWKLFTGCRLNNNFISSVTQMRISASK